MDSVAKAAALGVDSGYFDAFGVLRAVSQETLEAVTAALPPPHPVSFLPATLVLRERDTTVTLASDALLPVRWELSNEAGLVAKSTAHHHSFAVPDALDAGRYWLHVTDAAGATAQSLLLATPNAAFQGEFGRVWLLAVQLYGVRSRRNWGIGDFTDLARLIRLAASVGAAGIGLNPLHALFDDRPGHCSPYSPNSRLFLNTLTIDVEQAPCFAANDPEQAASIAELRSAALVDYAAVARLKLEALRQAYATFRSAPCHPSAAEFEEFRSERGETLHRFACFEVLRRRFDRPWWSWPEQWRKPDDRALAELRRDRPDEIGQVEFAQWVAGRQLRACRDLATALHLPVGLYLDLAVGVTMDGFDAWNEQVAISRHLAVGAPPDQLNTAGQNWGLAGFNAAGLERESFTPFRDMLRAAMCYSGAIRLDHVLGLKRLYLIPSGFSARDGAYVRMPFEQLLAVTVQESVAHRCVVIGEALGTVPEGFREQLAERGIWSYRVMMFERDWNGAFHGPETYVDAALVTFNTHDLPTFAGWAGSHDVALKHGLGIDPGETSDARRQAVNALNRATGADASSGFAPTARWLAGTPSRLLAIGLEDVLGVVDQPNIPGTIDEHPNWRRRLPVDLEDVSGSTNFRGLLEALAERAIGRT